MNVQEKSYQSDYCTGKINFCVAGNKKFLLGEHKIYIDGGGNAESIQFCEQKKINASVR
jgi:hypothetical protein